MELCVRKRNGNRQRCHNTNRYLDTGIREGKWFTSSKIPLNTTITLIYARTKKYTIQYNLFCQQELGMPAETATNWKNYLREV